VNADTTITTDDNAFNYGDFVAGTAGTSDDWRTSTLMTWHSFAQLPFAAFRGGSRWKLAKIASPASQGFIYNSMTQEPGVALNAIVTRTFRPHGYRAPKKAGTGSLGVEWCKDGYEVADAAAFTKMTDSLDVLGATGDGTMFQDLTQGAAEFEVPYYYPRKFSAFPMCSSTNGAGFAAFVPTIASAVAASANTDSFFDFPLFQVYEAAADDYAPFLWKGVPDVWWGHSPTFLPPSVGNRGRISNFTEWDQSTARPSTYVIS
jgi:hypothetical protein